jgi:hypothetical protein
MRARGLHRLSPRVPTAVGLWNERSYTTDYIATLRATLDGAGFESTVIVGSDSNWDIAEDILSNATVAAAVGVIGVHVRGKQGSVPPPPSPVCAHCVSFPGWPCAAVCRIVVCGWPCVKNCGALPSPRRGACAYVLGVVAFVGGAVWPSCAARLCSVVVLLRLCCACACVRG